MKKHYINQQTGEVNYDYLKSLEGMTNNEKERHTEKQILDRGYVTYCLTDSKGEFYNVPDQHINVFSKDRDYYWSEVYCEPGYLTVLIRKGKLLANSTDEELGYYHEQSKMNFKK